MTGLLLEYACPVGLTIHPSCRPGRSEPRFLEQNPSHRPPFEYLADTTSEWMLARAITTFSSCGFPPDREHGSMHPDAIRRHWGLIVGIDYSVGTA
jgi:hypothetical protein